MINSTNMREDLRMQALSVDRANPGGGKTWMDVIIALERPGGSLPRRVHVAVLGAIPNLVGQFAAVAICLVVTLALWVVLVVSWDQSLIHPSPVVFVGSAILGWLLGAQLQSRFARSAASRQRSVPQPKSVCWTRDPESPSRQQLLKSALENLRDPEALGRCPLTLLPALSNGQASGAELRELLVDVVGELAASRLPRDAEAGRLLFDYYIKRVGSHEVVMERLCLSRPTFYRRLHRGFQLVAARIDAVNELETRPREAIARRFASAATETLAPVTRQSLGRMRARPR